jgi:hypothetical protein
VNTFVRRLNSLLSRVRESWKQHRKGTARRYRPAASARARLSLEALEDRQLLSSSIDGVTYHGGPLLANVGVEALYYGNTWATDPNLQGTAGSINGFLASITNSTYMDQLKEYSEPGYVIGRGNFLGATPDATNPVLTPITLTNGQTVQVLTDNTIRGELDHEINSPVHPLQAPDANRLYIVYTPPNVEVEIPLPDPNTGQVVPWTSGTELNVNHFLGYHSSFTDSAGHTIYYAVVDDQTGNCPLVGYSPLQQFTKVSSHELAEAVTDPTGISWYDSFGTAKTNTDFGDEIGDLCNGYADITTLNGYTVQNEWSNQQAALTGNGHFLLTSPDQQYFKMDGTGSVLTLDSGGNLMQRNGTGTWSVLDSQVASYQLNPAQMEFYYLTTSGDLKSLGATGGTPQLLNHNITSFNLVNNGANIFALQNSGELIYWNAGGWAPSQPNVTSIAAVNGGNNIFALQNSGELMYFNNGTWSMYDQNVTSIVGSNGQAVFDLHVDGTLYAQYIDSPSHHDQLDQSVQSIVGSNGPAVFDLHTNGSLYAQYIDSAAHYYLLDPHTASIVGSNGPAVFDLHTNGSLYAQYIDSAAHYYLLDQNVARIASAGGSHVLDLHAANHTYNGMPVAASASVLDTNGVTSVAGAWTYTYYAGSTATGTPLPGAPTNPGTYTVVVTFTSSGTNYTGGSVQATFIIAQAAPTFSALTPSSTISYGTSSITLSGQLGVPGTPLWPPQGETVSVTINGVTQTTTLGTNGSFSLSFITSKLNRGTYIITYSYRGDANFIAATDATTTLTVS